MRTVTIATALALALAGCDGQETWQGDLLATGWNELPATDKLGDIFKPEAQVIAKSEESCNKGIRALQNQWFLYLDNKIQGNRARLKPLVEPATAENSKGTQQRENQIQQLLDEINAWTTLRDSMTPRCLLVKYTPPPFDGLWPQQERR